MASAEINQIGVYIGVIIKNMRARETTKLRVITEKYVSCPGSCEKGLLLGTLPDGGDFSLSCPYMTAKCAFARNQQSRLRNVFYDACKSSSMPPIHVGNLPNPKMTRAVMTADNWDWQRRPILLLLGELGIGKSFAAARAFYRWMRTRVPSDLWNKENDWQHLKEDVAKTLCWMHVYELANERNAPELAANAPFLVIDDLATEDATPATKTRVNYVVSKRYDAQTPTVITGNLNFKEFKEQYGERIADRVKYLGVIANLEDRNLRA